VAAYGYKLKKSKLFALYPAAEEKKHSIEIQLPFLQRVSKNFKIIPIIIGNIKEGDYKKIAETLMPCITPDTLVIASSDFTHYGSKYGYIPFENNIPENLQNLDMGVIKNILKMDAPNFLNYISKTGDTICGSLPISILIYIMKKKGAQAKLLKYSTSGEITGDYNNSVSYASIVFMKDTEKQQEPTELSSDEGEVLLKLARATLESYVKEGKIPDIDNKDITKKLQEERGVFVTLTRRGQLRGCIGYIQGIMPLYKAVIDNAINAATKDSRFPTVKPAELNKIEIEISVMTPLKTIDTIEEIQVGLHGLVLKKDFYSGVLLPQVATEYGWDRTTFLEHVSMKAGLNKNAWKDENAQIQIFSAQIFHER